MARDVLRVAGPDAERYLQGQLSADLDQLAPEEGAWSLLLEPTGKLGAWVRVSRFGGDEFVIDVDPGGGPAVVARLERFLLRTDATVTLAEPDEWVCIAIRGPVQVELDHVSGATVLTLPSPWPGLIGWDVLAPASAHVSIDTPMFDASVLDVVRVECGVPRLGAEIGEGTIPAEVGQWFIDASVSFTKGCYTGQELVARIDSRGGNAPRRLRAVTAEAAVGVGDAVVVGGEPVGLVTSSAVSPVVGPVGLVMLPRAVEPGTLVELTDPAGVSRGPATVLALPVADDLGTDGSVVSVSFGS
jgi:folate-binding protein YgfZ